MKKQLIALLLSATMVCSSGALSLVANAVDKDTNVSQSQSNDIEDSRGNIVKIYTTTDCFGEDMVDERTNIRGNAVTMTVLKPLKFKVSCSTKYGKLKSVSVTLHSSDKKTEKLTKGTDGYYVADVTRPLKYKLRVRFKTVDGKKITRTVSIDAKLLKQGYVANNGVYGVNYADLVLDDTSAYKISNNYVVPVGSKWILDSKYKYYIATYDDFKKNGLKSKWKRITDDYRFEKGYYTIKGIDKAGDTTIIAPLLKVSNQKAYIDCKDIVVEYGKNGSSNNWYFSTDNRNYEYIYHDIENLFNSRKDGAYKYKSGFNYQNMFNIFDLTNTEGKNAKDILMNMYSLNFTTFASSTDMYELPVTDVQLYYVKGEDISKELPDGTYYKKLKDNETLNEIHYVKYVEPNKQKSKEYNTLANIYYPYKYDNYFDDYWIPVGGTDIGYHESDWGSLKIKRSTKTGEVLSYEIQNETMKNDKGVVSAIDSYIKYYNQWEKASESNKQKYQDLKDTAYSKFNNIMNTRYTQYINLSTDYSKIASNHEHDYYTVKVRYKVNGVWHNTVISNVKVGY